MRRLLVDVVVAVLLVALLAVGVPAFLRLRLHNAMQNAVGDYGHYEAKTRVRVLLDRGADIRTVGHGGATVAHLACWQNDPELLQRALAGGVDPNRAEDGGLTPLMTAAFAPNLECARLLLAAGADPNRVKADGETALLFAVRNARHDVIPLLLAAGARADVTNAKGETPISVAKGLPHSGLWPMRPDLTAADFVRMLEGGPPPGQR